MVPFHPETWEAENNRLFCVLDQRRSWLMTLNDFFLLSLNLFLNHTCLEFPARKTSWAQGSTTESLSEPTGYTRSLRGPPRTVRLKRNLMCTWFSRDLQNSPSITSSTKQSKPLILSYLPCSDASKSKNDRDPKTTEITHLGIYDIYNMKYIFLWNIISAHSHYQMDIEFAEHLRKRVETPCMGVHPNNRIQLGQKGCGDTRVELNTPLCLSSAHKYKGIPCSFI